MSPHPHFDYLGQAISKETALATSGELCDIVADALDAERRTVREQLRAIRTRPGVISYTGRGRGAAQMTALDAARLVLVVAAAAHVKDSVGTLDVFSGLQPLGDRGKAGTLETALATAIEAMRTDVVDLPPYARPGEPDDTGAAMLVLISAMSRKFYSLPRGAVLRSFSIGGPPAEIHFASPDWPAPPDMDGDAFLRLWPRVGLVHRREVAAWSLAEIAKAL